MTTPTHDQIIAALDEIEERLTLAEHTPWRLEKDRTWEIICADKHHCVAKVQSETDADLIANAPTDIAALLRVARATTRCRDAAAAYDAAKGAAALRTASAEYDEAGCELDEALAALVKASPDPVAPPRRDHVSDDDGNDAQQ